MSLNLQKISILCLSYCILLLSSTLKFSMIVGKSFAYFSVIFFVVPLLGAFFGGAQAIIITTFALATKVILTSYPITGGIPTLLAVTAWSTHTQFVSKQTLASHLGYFLTMAALPASCMALFMTHPTVGQGFFYALYWLIPIVFYAAHIFFRRSSTFTVALSTTFIAHAVGSTIWLFTVPMKPEQWIALMPVVAVERLIIASGMTLLFFVVQKIASTKFLFLKKQFLFNSHR
ncbi:hypothetical protein JST56_07555 [Candidatus Dependentiae bacterium]|jgi:hypothetical protein|nr:hypothetical protein [Candidatus Dependentiae bacterium]